MKRNKAFTLIELLAVILILGIITLIAIPTISKIIDSVKISAFKITLNNIERKVSQACNVQQLKGRLVSDNYAILKGSISPNVDIKGNLPDGNIDVDNSCGLTYTLSNKDFIAAKNNPDDKPKIIKQMKGLESDVEYMTNTLNGATPKLNDGMIPVTIDNDGKVKKANTNSKWYDYKNKEWANAILVTNASKEKYKSADTGSTILNTDIIAYLVWIPRFRYAIPSGDGARDINVIFENKNTKKSNGNAIDENYYTHPAFTFGNTELDGFWVGKFETTGTSDLPTVLPNISSLRTQCVSKQFETAKKFTNYGLSGDTHMMKNSEWGAVSYLVMSKYGKQSEVRINNNSSFITGCGANIPDSSASNVCEIQYGSNKLEYPQSTTNNITGIFDMSGGGNERVMSNYKNYISQSGFTNIPDLKYYDTYTSSEYTKACNGNLCLGHALNETNKWNEDSYDTLNDTSQWILRGGSNDSEKQSGIFSITTRDSSANSYRSFRIVISN